MHHKLKHRHLGRNSAHRRSLLNNLVKSLIEHEQIKTTTPKAKELRVVAEKLITLGKKQNLAAKKEAYSQLQSQALVSKLFSKLYNRYSNRQGGYTRLVKAGFRKGDSAEVSIIELIDRDESAKGKYDLERLKESGSSVEKIK